MVNDKLTNREDGELEELKLRPAGELTFNELLAVAGAPVGGKVAHANATGNHQAGRDFALALKAMEDALTRYNSGCYRLAGTWKRADPDRKAGTA